MIGGIGVHRGSYFNESGLRRIYQYMMLLAWYCEKLQVTMDD